MGNLRTDKKDHPARVPFTNYSNIKFRLVVLYFMNLPWLQLLALHTYEQLFMRNRTVP